MPDETGRSRGRAAVLAWAVAGAILLVNGATMLGFAGSVADALRAPVLVLGVVVALLGNLALARAVQLFRRPPS